MSHFSKGVVGRVAALGLLAVAGCGQPASNYDANVQGTVTIDGELAPGGSVTFTPKGDGPVATGVVGPEGAFVLKIGQGAVAEPNRSLIPSGEYVAAVVVTGAPVANPDDPDAPPQAGPRLMADKYADKETSGLEFTVKKGANVFTLELDGPSANPPAEEEDAVESDDSPSAESTESTSVESSEESVKEGEAESSDGAEVPSAESPSADGEEAQQ